MRSPPRDGIASEVDQPFGPGSRLRVRGMEMQRAVRAEQLAHPGVDLKMQGQRAKVHPLVDGVDSHPRVDREFRADGERGVGPVDGSLMRKPAGVERRVPPRDRGPYLRARPRRAPPAPPPPSPPPPPPPPPPPA